uniref:Exonuclease 1 n=3 Tax=Lygus hesperus TaxID=30085 RepID=A0A0A9Y086_LYGHE
MGITGLIPFLKPASRPVNIKEYGGCTVAIDSYCWLHRGAIACAEKLVRGDSTDVYVNYCIKYVEMLLSHQVKPIMVFDGRHLPAKADTEKSRRERRENNKKRAADLLRQDRPDEARNVMKGCIDITPEMAFSLIKRCRAMGVDCIVAPFEADAQLAYLNLSGIAHIVITEDSDLLLFGCEKVLFKMDLVGNGLLIEQNKLPLAMKVHPDKFSMDKFRHMCILSGCDYLASLPGIGLGKACKFIKRTAETNISRALTKLGAHLNMSNLVVSPDYKEKFLIADSMFKHQPVFDPISRKVVPLTPLPEGATGPDLEVLPPETSYQLALGNLDPFTLKRFDSWDPDSDTVKNYRTNGWNKGGHSANSMWSKSFVKPKPIQPLDRRKVDPTTTQGKVVVHSVPALQDRINTSIPAKKKPEEELEELREIFKIRSPPCKKSKTEDLSMTFSSGSIVVESSDPEDEMNDLNTTSVEDDILNNLGFDNDDDDDEIAQVDDLMPKSPVLMGTKFISHNRNKFSCSKKLYNSDSSESRGLSGLRKMQASTQIDEDNIVCSRFFSSQDSNCENRPISSLEGPKIGRLDDDKFETELNRIIQIDGRDGMTKVDSAVVNTPKQSSKETTFVPPLDYEAGNSNKILLTSPLAAVSQLDKNLKFTEDRPSLLARLDKMSQILSEKSPQKPISATSSFNWQKKKTTPQQKSFTSYLSPGSTPSRSKTTKSVSKPSGLSKNKKPVVGQGSLLENFGFKPKPKMTL